MQGKALLFGLNYAHCSQGQLNGCINDVRKISDYIKNTLKIPIDVYTDDVNKEDTSGKGIIRRLYELALESYKSNLDFVWIHYSGHGSYVQDTNGDEKDGQDECLVPCDYETNGMIPDDYIKSLFSYFNPRTRVICVFDCCHSGTMGDMKYSWNSARSVAIENIECNIPSKIITLSGCLDAQTSSDTYNLMGDSQYVGALTACLLMVLQKNPAVKNDVFALLEALRTMLKEKGYSQIPKLGSTYNLIRDRVFIPST